MEPDGSNNGNQSEGNCEEGGKQEWGGLGEGSECSKRKENQEEKCTKLICRGLSRSEVVEKPVTRTQGEGPEATRNSMKQAAEVVA